jgi:hypothetical protein
MEAQMRTRDSNDSDSEYIKTASYSLPMCDVTIAKPRESQQMEAQPYGLPFAVSISLD